MKSMWIATGVVVGLGVAGIVAASASDSPPSRIIVGDSVVAEDSTTAGSTSTTDDSTTTTDVDTSTTSTQPNAPTVTHGIANIPATTVPSVATTTTHGPSDPGLP